MKPRAHDPLRLDVAALATEAGVLEGRWPGDQLPRLAHSTTPPQDTAPADVAWRAEGRRVPVTGGEPELWLHVSAQTPVWLTCQRCLRPFESPIEIDQSLRFVRGEAEAEALDAELEEDVLALPRALDLRELVEDELLLALPLVPRHETCPAPLNFSAGDVGDEVEPERVNPFAALQALKGKRGG
jgi:uncharacterized protein